MFLGDTCNDLRWSAMLLLPQNRRKTAYFIAACGRALSPQKSQQFCQSTTYDEMFSCSPAIFIAAMPYKARPHAAMKKSQQCGQSATHDAMISYSPAMLIAAMVIRYITLKARPHAAIKQGN